MNTSEQHKATYLVNLVLLVRPVSSENTEFFGEQLTRQIKELALWCYVLVFSSFRREDLRLRSGQAQLC